MPFLIVANWKMYLTHTQELDFCRRHLQDLAALATQQTINLVLCPSFLTLPFCNDLFAATKIAWGAQDCSDHDSGACTGQISAPSLKGIGCSYGIVGHSEHSVHTGTAPHVVAEKTARLFEQGICPIICIGETEQERLANKTKSVLINQLTPLIPILERHPALPFCIAYEPVWAIGSGKVPSTNDLTEVFTLIARELTVIPATRYRLLYGGSVTKASAPSLVKVKEMEGFLIGGTSLDFQEFKNIVELCTSKPA